MICHAREYKIWIGPIRLIFQSRKIVDTVKNTPRNI